MSFPLVRPRPFRVLYILSVVLVTLFVMAFIWFGLYAVMNPVRAGILSTMSQYDVENSTYQSFELADTFMSNLWTYILVIVVFALLYWVWVYSQRKGEVMVVR